MESKVFLFLICSHVGDLGNLVADASGTIKAKFSDHLISVVGPLSVLGRAFVVR